VRARNLLRAGLALSTLAAPAQEFQLPRTLTAGAAFSIPTSGSGKAVLYIVGPTQALRRDVNLGDPVAFAAGDLSSAGHYLVALVESGSTQMQEFDVQPASQAGSLGFLAKPSRLPVNIHNGISGAVYVFDPYHNLITTPTPASLELAGAGGTSQTRTVTTRNGLAWVTLDSSAKESAARFTARVGGVSSTRVIDQVPGDPCSISISAKPNGSRLEVQTAPVRDCNGNAIPDGTIVTFTETSGNLQSTVDAPLKQGVASVTLPATKRARISVASGVVAGNEIQWNGAR